MDATEIFYSPWTWAVIVISSLYAYYRYLKSQFTYFSERGIQGPSPIPIFGNTWGIWKQNMPKVDQAFMKKYGKIAGTYDGTQPNLWTTDADIIKSVFVKDFDHFINRRALTFETKVIRRFLPFMRNQEWKDVRSAITPVFTTGKIKQMSHMIKECADRLVIKLETVAQTRGKIYAKAQFSAFTMDVIARCVFGVKLENLGAENDVFMKNAKAAFNPPTQKSPMALIIILFPILVNLGERFFMMDELVFFIKIIEKMLKDREDSNQKYHDFVEMATEAISSSTKEVNGQTVPMWTKEEVQEIITAESIIFLLAGFDTTASALTHTIFQLARHPQVQEKLYNEIQNKLELHGDVGHEMILDFPYIDQVINEVFRIYPTFPRIERECNKDITIKGVHFKKGTIVTVPTFALHYDPEYYSDPLTFDPERWSPANKSSLNSYAFMPFGMGPRNCVGMRFAMEEIKIALCLIVNKFRFFAVEETPDEITFEDGLLQIAQPIETTVGIEVRN